MGSDQIFKTYLKTLKEKLSSQDATEHTHRGALETLLEGLDESLTAINEPRRIDCGAPDYILVRGGAPIGYIEAKDIGADLHTVERSEQLDRYRASLSNLILTDYLEFRWYVEGELRHTASLGRLARDGKIKAEKGAIEKVANLLERFLLQRSPTISDPGELARRMAALARMLRDVLQEAFLQEQDSGVLHDQLSAFQETLIPDLSVSQFADMYAQTITYGLFAARIRVREEEPFSREKAAWNLPKTNPFLRKLFNEIAGPDLDDRIAWLVDDIAHLLAHADMPAILQDFGAATRQEDPVVHFYETFLKTYDPAMRQARGVYYTPEPVVSYIIRSLDSLLKTRFDKPDGLADRETLILDPAAGTATFLYFVIQHVYDSLDEMGMGGMWKNYVQEQLLPRLFGFELLMAPYAVAHMKLGLQLQELGYDFKGDQRLGVYLTNTLGKPIFQHEAAPFARYITEEANAAAEIKEQAPIMVVLGNPPYSVSSANKGEYIENLMGRYKRAVRDERNIQPLSDDYIKFIRFAHHRINKTGHGLIGMITNHSYLSGLIHRGMRQELLKDFDELYLLNLHGNALMGETAPDGGADENVFDIRQGVAILLAVKLPRPQIPGNRWHTSPALWKKLKPLAREKRNDPTEAEEKLWQHLRKKQLQGYKFRRQHTIDRFIVDFYCRDAGLVLEVDGPIHQYTPEEDALREQFLEEQSLTVLRFDNEQVLKDIDAVLETIAASLPHPRSATTPSPSTGRGPGGGVYYADLWGRREAKYQALLKSDVNTTEWQELSPTEPYYFLVPKDFDLLSEYQHGWRVDDIFPVHSSGIKTHRDDFVIDFDEAPLRKRIQTFRDSRYSDEEIRDRFDLNDTRDWKLSEARSSFQKQDDWKKLLRKCLYRPFDFRVICYSDDLIELSRFNVMQHLLRDNKALVTTRVYVADRFTSLLVSQHPIEMKTGESTRGTYCFPLYVYNNTEQEKRKRSGSSAFTLSLFEGQEAYQTRQPNLSQAFLAAVKDKLGLGFVPEGHGDLKENFGPEDIFEYAYAVFHAPTYRERYAEFLKIDFPRLPLTGDLELFRALVEKGRELVSLHLMEADVLRQTGVRYPVSGSNHVASRHPRYLAPDEPEPESGEPLRAGRVYINKEQYFEGIEPDVWEFQIGGYQVLDKWLKDRKRADRALDFDDVRHYGRIVVALRHTLRLMAEIDDLIPGWPLR